MIKKLLLFLVLFIVVFNSYSSVVGAMTQSDLEAILQNRAYFDPVDNCSIASTGAASVESGSADENKKVIWQYLMGKGLTAEQTAGFMGNLESESAHTFDPRIVEFGKKNSRGETSVQGKPSSLDDNVPTDGEGGYGLVQWTSYYLPGGEFTLGRKQGLLKLLKERQASDPNIKASNLGLQLDFLWQEVLGYKNSVYKPLLTSTTIREASDVILLEFERPKDQSEGTQKYRASLGDKIFQQFAGQSLGTIASTPGAAGNCAGVSSGSVDCSSASGNAKIVCAAQQNFGTMYCFTDNHNGHLGNCGHGPQQWLDAVEKNGKDSAYYSTECSGFVNIALYQAFGYDKDNCSSTYKNDTNNFRVISLESVVPGDLVIQHINEGCGTTNHVAIVESYDPATGKLVTLESTAGKNDDGKAGISGRLSYRKLGSDFDGAVRYIGQGSEQ